MRKKKNFKPKNTKYISILKIHEEKIKEFQTKDAQLKEINIKINKINQQINNLNKEYAINNINNDSFKCGEIKQKIFDLNKDIQKLEDDKIYISSGQKECDYILSTCNIINDYIDCENLENEILNNTQDLNDDEINMKLHDLNIKKNNVIENYMRIVDPNYVTYRNLYDYSNNFCKNCKNVQIDIKDGFGICPECGLCSQVVQILETLSWQQTQEMDLRPQFTYDRSSHLDEWLRRFTAKENKEIPQEILDKVILEAHKERIKDLNELDETKVKKYLKKLNLKDYYDNVISIINRINKRPSFVLTPEIEAKIKQMFDQIQDPFEKHKGKNRKSMLSYSYLLNKFFLILDLPEFSKYFFLLKSPEKLRIQDEIFKKIVDDMVKIDPSTNWRFFSSL